MSKGKKKRGKEGLVLKISDKDWQKILNYCKAASPHELMGLAQARITGDSTIEVTDPIILKQKVTGVTCEFDKKDFAQWIGTSENVSDTKVFWHSHVNMEAFFSGTDRETSLRMANIGHGASKWFVSIVANVKGEYEAVVDVFHPFKACIDARIEIKRAPNSELALIREEVNGKVEVELPAPALPTSLLGSMTSSDLFRHSGRNTQREYFADSESDNPFMGMGDHLGES